VAAACSRLVFFPNYDVLSARIELNTTRKTGFATFAVLFFIQWMGLAAWTIPLTLVLQAHGLKSIQPYAFATSALAAFVSPLFFGAMADRHVAPTKVLRRLALATAAAITMACTAIQYHWPPLVVLGLIQIYALCVAPTSSLSTTIVMSQLAQPTRQFGPIRAMGTIGWMAGCWMISLLQADDSTLAGFSSAFMWLGLALYSLRLPEVPPPESAQHLTLRQRLGLDALALLRQSDHRVVFLTAALFSIPLAAFYPFTPPHLAAVGMAHPAAWMSLAQTTEILAMFSLAFIITRVRLKWILVAGLGIGLLRYLLCAGNGKLWLLAGIVLHGASYTLFFTTAQIYVNERMAPEWRARAQALLTLMINGVGNFIGYLGTGWWYKACTPGMATNWPLFWCGLAGAIGVVTLYFLITYRGIHAAKALA